MKWLKRGIFIILFLGLSVISQPSMNGIISDESLNLNLSRYRVTMKDGWRFTIYPRDYQQKRIDSMLNSFNP